MKTIFKKSKVYDEALELQKKIISILTNLQAISESISLELRKLEDELRESEDEEIYREIYSIVHCYYKRKANLLVSFQDRNEMLEKWKKAKSFLEKQKQKPSRHSNNTLENASKEFREKNQPPIEYQDDTLVEIIKGEFEGFRTLLKKNGIDYEPQRTYWEGFARLFKSSAKEYVKEQKPAEKEQDSIAFLEQHGYIIVPPHAPVSIVPSSKATVTEWSEEDEKIVTNACKELNCYANSYYNGGNDTRAKEVYEVADKLKSLRSQPKPEWSEEDKLTLNAAIYWIMRRLKIESVIDISTEYSPLSMRKTAERLKSILARER